MRLEASQGRGVIEQLRLAGAIVAYTSRTLDVDSGCTRIIVMNVQQSRTLFTAPGGCSIDAGFIQRGGVASLVADSQGSAAWILVTGKDKMLSFEVQDAESSGVVVTLDKGPGIVPGSLRLANETVSWEDSGNQYSQHLC